MKSNAAHVALRIALVVFVILLAGCNGSLPPTSVASTANTTSKSVSENKNGSFIRGML